MADLTVLEINDVLEAGQQRGLPPERIAAAVRTWQSAMVDYGRTNFLPESDPKAGQPTPQNPEKYWKGVSAIDEQVHAAMTGLRSQEQARIAQQAFPDPKDRTQFFGALEAGGFDPDKMLVENWHTTAKAMADAGSNPVFSLPIQQSGTIGNGPNTLASYELRRRPAGDGYEAFVQPVGEGKKPVVVQLPGLDVMQVQAKNRLGEAQQALADHQSRPSMSEIGFQGALTDESFATDFEAAKSRYDLVTGKDLSAALHTGLQSTLTKTPAFLDQLPQDTVQQFTTRPLLGVTRSLAQAAAGAGFGDKAALTPEGAEAVDVVAPGRLRSRFEADGSTPIGDQISQGVESAITLLGPSLLAKGGAAALGVAGRGAAVAARTGEAAAKVSEIAGQAGWGTLYATSYGSNYAGALQEADALQATDPERANRIRSLAQFSSLAKAGIELASERIFMDEAKLMRGQRQSWRSIAAIPLKETGEEFAGALASNVVNTATGQKFADPAENAEGGFWGSLPMMGLSAGVRAVQPAAPAVNAAPPDLSAPVPGSSTNAPDYSQNIPANPAGPDGSLFPEQTAAAAPVPVVATTGRSTAYGYSSDPTPDSNSSAGIGAWVPDAEAAAIRRGEPSDFRLRPGDLAVSRDIEAQFRRQGLNPGDTVTLQYGDGSTHTGRWMDRTSDTLSGRFDLYSPDGPPANDGSPITGFTAGGGAMFTFPPANEAAESNLTTATAVDPQGTVPETPETLAEQRRRVLTGQRPAMLFPGVTPEQVPKEFQPGQDDGLLLTHTPAGTFLHPFDVSEQEIQQAVAEGRTGHLLGMASATKPEGADAALVQRTADGTEVTAVAVTPETAAANAAALQNAASPGDTLTLETPEQVLESRMNGAESNEVVPGEIQPPAESNEAVAGVSQPPIESAAAEVEPVDPILAMEQEESAAAALSPLQQAEQWADRAIAEGRKQSLSGMPDPTLLVAYAVKGTALIARGVHDFAAWSSEMLTEFGESIRPHLDRLFRQSRGQEDVPLTDSPVPATADGPPINRFGQRVQADERLRSSWRESFQPAEYSPFAEEDLSRRVRDWIGRQGGMEGAAQLFLDPAAGLRDYERNALGQQLAIGLDLRARRAESAGNAPAVHEAEQLLDTVVAQLEGLATQAGQALRAFGMWSRLSPRGIIRQIQRQTDRARTEHVKATLDTTPSAAVEATKAAATAATAKATEARVSSTQATVARWISKLATSQSDTLSWGTAPVISALEKLLRAHMKEVIPDFAAQAQALGVPSHEAAVLDRLVLEEHRRSVNAARDEAILKLTKQLSAPKATRATQAKIPPLAKALLEAHALSALTDKGFLDAYAGAFNLPKFTPEFAARIRTLTDRVQATPAGSWMRMKAQRDLMAKLAIWEGVPPGDVLIAFWYANILSGLGTQLVNVFGNAQHLLLKTVQVLGTNHPVHSYRFLQGMMSGAAQGAKQGFRALKDGVPVIKSADEWQKIDVLEMMWSEDNQKMMFLIGKYGAASWGRYVFRSLTAADSFFFQTLKEGESYLLMSRAMEKGADFKISAGLDLPAWNSAMDQAKGDLLQAGVSAPATWEIDRRAYEIIENRRSAEVIAQARKFAAEGTYNYNPTGPMGVIADVLKGAVKGIPPLRAIVPFVNIPANLVDQGLNWTPVGLARAAWGKHAFNDKGQSWSRQERYEKLFSGALGTAGGFLLYGLALGKDEEGDDDETVDFMIYGMGPADKNKRGQMPEGWKPFTVKIGKHYYSYAESPLSLLLSAVGGALDAQRYAGKDKKAIRAAMPASDRYLERFGDVMTAAGQGFFRTGTMSSLDKLFNVLDGRGKGGVAGVFNRTASGLIPMQGLLRNVAEMMDPTIIDTKTFKGAMLTNLPVFRSEGTPMLDAFGENIRNPGTVPLNRLVVPQGSKGPEWDWLQQRNLTIPGLDNEIINTKYLPDSRKETFQALGKEGITGLAADRAWRAIEMERKQKYLLTPDEATKFQRTSGPLIKDAVKQLRREVETKQFVPASPDALQRRLADKVTMARRIARVKMVK